MKGSSLTEVEESSSFNEYSNTSYTRQIYRVLAGDFYIGYIEDTYETVARHESSGIYFYDYDMYAKIQIAVDEEYINELSVEAYFLDGKIQDIDYHFSQRNE